MNADLAVRVVMILCGMFVVFMGLMIFLAAVVKVVRGITSLSGWNEKSPSPPRQPDSVTDLLYGLTPCGEENCHGEDIRGSAEPETALGTPAG